MGETDAGNALIDWVLRSATTHDDLARLLTGVGEQLIAAGLPVRRASLDIPTIDPNLRAISHKWWRDRASSVEMLPHGPGQDGTFQRSVI